MSFIWQHICVEFMIDKRDFTYTWWMAIQWILHYVVYNMFKYTF